MEHTVSWWSIVSNIGIQIINLIIFFLLFRYFVGRKIAVALEERRALHLKLNNADAEYHNIITAAQAQKTLLIQEGVEHKQSLIAEGQVLAQKQSDKAISMATTQAQDIITKATHQSELMQSELQTHRAQSVKKTAGVIVHKLIGKDMALQSEYLDALVSEIRP